MKNTGLWKYMLFEMIINLIAPFPFLNGIKVEENVENWGVRIHYEFNDFLLFFMFSRVYLLAKFLLYLTEFMNPRS